MDLIVRVLGRPAPQGSHEIGANGRIMHSSNYLTAWRENVNRATRQAYVDAGLTRADMPLIPNPKPVFLQIAHFLQDDQGRAAGTSDVTGVPDLDKLVRATIDGLGAARAFANDSQVVFIATAKSRTPDGIRPGANIVISDKMPEWVR